MVGQRAVQLVSQRAEESIVIRVRGQAQPAIVRHHLGCRRDPCLPNRGISRAVVDGGEDLVAKYLTNPIDHGGNFGVEIHSGLPNGTAFPRLGHRRQRIRSMEAASESRVTDHRGAHLPHT